jgi:cytochrome c oxidase subunit 2
MEALVSHWMKGVAVKMKNRLVVVSLKAFSLFLLLFVLNSAHGTNRSIEIHARRFSFVPAEITITKGQTVTLDLTSDDVPHSLVIKALGINQSITKGHTSEVILSPTTVGDFRGQCGRFCGSGHGSMVFTVHVKQD